MTRQFSQRSLDNLRGIHPDLIRVMANALQTSPLDFTVIEGLRTRDRQRELVAKGASRTMNSRHLYGMAVDLMPVVPKGEDPWDWKFYDVLGPAVKSAADMEGVPVTWGGDWQWRDGPHFELPHALYPDGMSFASVDPATVQPRGLPGSQPVVIAARKFLLTIPAEGAPTIEEVL